MTTTKLHIKQIDNTRPGSPTDGDVILKVGSDNLWSSDSGLALRLPTGTTGSLPTGVTGYVRYDTTVSDYVAWDPNTMDWVSLTRSTTTTFEEETFIYNNTTPPGGLSPTGNPATMNFTWTLSKTPIVSSIEIFIFGVRLKRSSFSVSGTALTFIISDIPYLIENGDEFIIRYVY